MIQVAPSTPHTDAVISLLEAADLIVGRALHPEGGGWQGEPGRADYVPYDVVYPAPGTPDGNLAEPLEYLDYKAQITCWGATETQAEQEADRVRAAVVGQLLTVAGRSSYRIQQPPGSRHVRRDDSVSPPEWQAVVDIEVRTQHTA